MESYVDLAFLETLIRASNIMHLFTSPKLEAPGNPMQGNIDIRPIHLSKSCLRQDIMSGKYLFASA